MTERQFRAWLIPKLRRFSVYWPQRRYAREDARIEVPDGNFKNGNPKIKVMYKCNICTKIVGRDEIHIDHIKPVVDLDGFNTWDDYINSLFCDVSNLQAICEECHAKKSLKENQQRALNRKKSIVTKKKLTYSGKYVRKNKRNNKKRF